MITSPALQIIARDFTAEYGISHNGPSEPELVLYLVRLITEWQA